MSSRGSQCFDKARERRFILQRAPSYADGDRFYQEASPGLGAIPGRKRSAHLQFVCLDHNSGRTRHQRRCEPFILRAAPALKRGKRGCGSGQVWTRFARSDHDPVVFGPWSGFAVNAGQCLRRRPKRIGALLVGAPLRSGRKWKAPSCSGSLPRRSIAAASCCRGATRWVGSLPRSEAFRGRESRAGVESYGLGQLGLAFVEGPEAVRAQFQGAGDVQRVQGAEAESGAVTPCEIDACLPGLTRKTSAFPNARTEVAFEAVPCQSRIGKGKPSKKCLPEDCICQFAAIEGRQANSRFRPEASHHFGRMRVPNVDGNEKAGIDVDDQ